jgi:hypothetical protein
MRVDVGAERTYANDHLRRWRKFENGFKGEKIRKVTGEDLARLGCIL